MCQKIKLISDGLLLLIDFEYICIWNFIEICHNIYLYIKNKVLI